MSKRCIINRRKSNNLYDEQTIPQSIRLNRCAISFHRKYAAVRSERSFGDNSTLFNDRIYAVEVVQRIEGEIQFEKEGIRILLY